MPRIRTIKPEFCTSEQVANCSTTARLLFVLMWCHCDDAGRHPASVKRLKMECFPADPFTDEEVSALIDELISADLIVQYVHKSKDFWQVTGWHHQRIDKPSYRHGPLDSSGNPIPIGNHSSNGSGMVVDDLPPEPTGSLQGMESRSAAACAAAESLRRMDLQEVSRLAAKLSKACRSLTPEIAWQLTVIAEAAAPGMVSEFLSKVHAGTVRQPKGYLEGALRKECTPKGFDWRDLIPLVPPQAAESMSPEEFERRRNLIIRDGRKAGQSEEEIQRRIDAISLPKEPAHV